MSTISPTALAGEQVVRRSTALLAVLAVTLGVVTAVPFPGAASASTPLTFTNAGATGLAGPTQAQVDAAYAGTALDGDVTVVTQGVQEWVAPRTGRYRFTVVGAHGAAAANAANSRGGRGALITAEREVTEGTRVFIVVGQAGSSGGGNGGGGGASFVNVGSRTATDALIVAGGGGGARQNATTDGGDANVHPWGLTTGADFANDAGVPNLNNTENNGLQCTNGQDAPPNEIGGRTECWTDVGLGGIGPTSWHGDGGAGWNGDGHRDPVRDSERAVRLGDATVSPVGGRSEFDNADGGFGGGGSGNGRPGGGGGGGYTGGDGGRVAGGGGSFVAASFDTVSIGIDTGRSFDRDGTPVHGSVTIELVPSAPTLAPTTASSITTTAAVLAGEVTADGTSTVTERGFVWSTGTDPELGASGVASATSGTGTGTFTASVSGLSPGTIYHARAYAINQVGTSYGAPVTFSTGTLAPLTPPAGAQAAGTAEGTDGTPDGTSDGPPVPTSVPAGQGRATGAWALALAFMVASAATFTGALGRAPRRGARGHRA